jgi:uncharacterized protein
MFYPEEIEMENGYQKELPPVNQAMEPFWEGARNGRLMVYHCGNCGKNYWPAIDCPACDSPHMEWTQATGKGVIFTYTIMHQVYHPGWKSEVPYNVAWVKLDEGPILISNIADCQNADLHIGMRVEAIFDKVTPEVTLPKFKPAK